MSRLSYCMDFDENLISFESGILNSTCLRSVVSSFLRGQWGYSVALVFLIHLFLLLNKGSLWTLLLNFIIFSLFFC